MEEVEVLLAEVYFLINTKDSSRSNIFELICKRLWHQKFTLQSFGSSCE